MQLRSGVFLLAQLDADIDENAMAIIELKLEPGPWRKTWDVQYFLKALEDTGKLIIGKLSEFIGILTANCCTAILRPFQRCFWS